MAVALPGLLTVAMASCLSLGMSVVLALAPSPALAGAWPQPEDGGQVVFNALPFQTRLQGYNRAGQPAGTGTDRRLETSIYWEHGVTDRWTVGMQPRLQAIWMHDQSGRSQNFGMAEEKVFSRYTLYRGDWNVFSVQGQIGAPGIAQHNTPRLAEPNAAYEVRAMYGHAFTLPAGMSGFLDLQAAFNYRPGPPADEMTYKVTGGIRVAPGWLVMGQTVSTIGLRNARGTGPDYSIHRALLSLVVDLAPHWQVEVGYIKELGGRHVALGQGVLGALWYRY
jgi:hypothetical protein